MSTDPNNSKRTPILGCIADDVTGATDLATNLVQGGMRVVQWLGVPTSVELQTVDADAVVVALKTRSIAKEKAVELSLAALDALREVGIERFFFKYCSTFDSTDEGNIGPVAEALVDALDAGQTIFCPAFPRGGRTVFHGHLFVHGKLLHESGMENHPLNPMTDANLVRVLRKQTNRRVGLLNYNNLTAEAAKAQLDRSATNGGEFVIADACDDQHLQVLAEAVVDQPLVTGGSGIARYLPDAYRKTGFFSTEHYSPSQPVVSGGSLIVAGSCSIATNAQVAWMRPKCEAWKVDVGKVLHDFEGELKELAAWANKLDISRPTMIYSSADPEEVGSLQTKHGREVVAEAVEEFLASATERLVREHDVRKLVLAGGETSGAIVQKLGVRALRIGPEICTGVPWTESLCERPLALALKSGNFGSEDFFERALEMLA